jgi:hypothetical protein
MRTPADPAGVFLNHEIHENKFLAKMISRVWRMGVLTRLFKKLAS